MKDEASLPADQALVALSGSRALIRIEGRGSFNISASLKQFGEAALQKQVSLILVDMSRCIGMDSTFMGVLAGLAARLKGGSGRLVLVNCSPRVRNLLATLGLDEIIAAHETGKTPAEFEALLEGRKPVDKLEATATRDAATVKTMLDAHQNLVDLVPENLPQFKDVLLFLREEVNKKTQDHKGGR